MPTQSPFLSEEMRTQAVGLQSEPLVLEVEKGAIIRFAQAIEDPNPLWNDEAAARQSRHGGMIAPPTFLRSAPVQRPELPFPVPFEKLLDGGSEWEYFQPVCAGDRITLSTTMESLNERSGRLGAMLFIVYATEYTNQDGQQVAIQRNTIIRY